MNMSVQPRPQVPLLPIPAYHLLLCRNRWEGTLGTRLTSVKRATLFHKILSLDLRPKQCQGVRALLQGRDVLAVLPTEYSKSLISKDFLNFQHEYHMFYI